MTRSILLSALALLLTAGAASAATYYNGHPVRVVQVGAISAAPCPDARGCVRGVVELRFHRRHSTHLVRCGHPRRLHVVRAFRDSGERWADVYACSRHYVWRLP